MPVPQESFQKIGLELRQRREQKELSLEEASFSTRIRVRYLRSLEDGNWEGIPSLTQGKGFLRAYAGYLGLDPVPLLALLSSEPPTQPAPAPPKPEPDPPSEAALEHAAAAGAIFSELGQTLRKQRELLGLSLEDVERHTYLRIHYLQAMENGEFDKLPSPVQGRGMLNNFATFLGLNTDRVLLRYAEGLQAQLMVRREAMNPSGKPRRVEPPGDGEEAGSSKNPNIFRRLLSRDVLVAVVLVLFLAGFITWGGMRILSVRSDLAAQTPVSTAPSIADVLLRSSGDTGKPSPTPLVTPTTGITLTAIAPNPIITDLPPAAGAITAAEDPEGTPGAEGGSPDGEDETEEPAAVAVELRLVVRQRVWFRVIADGEVIYDERAIPNSAYQFNAKEQIEILTGNGAALQVFYNGRDLGPLGDMGEVIHLVFSVAGVQTPTPVYTPTGGPTEIPTLSPATLQATATQQLPGSTAPPGN